VGRTDGEVLSDNTRRWSGDHCVDPAAVPGVLFCNHRLTDAAAAIVDLAPTILDLFGVPVPAYMDGKVLNLANGDDGTSQSGIQKSNPTAIAGTTR
jgi:bisphosphoglycerate-independent phosphoglycerate mutase (AlkP superfamily)